MENVFISLEINRDGKKTLFNGKRSAANQT